MIETAQARQKALASATERLREHTEQAVAAAREVQAFTLYSGLTLGPGIRKFLAGRDKPASVEEIAAKLWWGGVSTRCKDLKRFTATTKTVLDRMRRRGVVRFISRFRRRGKPAGYVLAE